MKVVTNLSNHHVHLDSDKVTLLFGWPDALTPMRKLGGEYVSNEWVEVIGPKGSFKCHVIFGEYRNRTQVEVLRADNYALGIDAPVRESGSKDGLATLTVRGPKGEFTEACAMVAWRHIHVGREYLKDTPFLDKKFCRLRKDGDRAVTFENVLIVAYEGADFKPFCHLDTEEGNAAFISNGDLLEMLPQE